MTSFVAASRSQSRVFVSEGSPGPKNTPSFQGCLVLGGASQGFGDTEYIYCPDPDAYGKFITVGEIVGRAENVETSLSGHFPLNSLSKIIQWARANTPLAIHVHFGLSSKPQNFNVFDKAVVFDEGARITSTDIEEMGSLEESGSIGQSADISAADYYEVIAMSYISRVPELIDTPGVGVDISPIYDDNLPLDNRFGYYMVSEGDGAANDPTLIYSVDGGASWSSITITDLNAALAAGVAAVNDVPVVIGAAGNLYYADVLNGATSMTEVTHAQAMNCIASIGAAAFIGGAAGYVGRLDDYASAPTALTTGSASNILSIHALDGGVVLVGDANGRVYYALDGENFGEAVVDDGVGITAVCAINTEIFWAGTENGDLYFTVDGGATWESRSFSGSGTGSITDISFPTLSVGFVSHEPASGDAKLFKTVGAGAVGTWFEVPRTGSLPTADSLLLSTVKGDPNRILATGPLTTTDGVIVYGVGQ